MLRTLVGMKTGTTSVYGPIWIDADRMSGAPCFTGTRVPVEDLFNWLDDGGTVAGFISEFDQIPKEQIMEVLHRAKRLVTSEKLLHEDPA